MYEYIPSGLGWETVFETNFFGGRTDTPKRCMELTDRGVPASETEQRCFKDTVAERTLAIESECSRIGWFCETSGERGETWCCPIGRPASQIPEGDVVPGDPSIVVIPPAGGEPRPFSQHSFLSRLSHPGAIAAFGFIGVAAFLGYRMLISQQDRWVSEEWV